jgi:DNA-binding transcriptional MocR family regulator
MLTCPTSGATSSGGAPSHLTSTFIHHLLDTGALQTHIDKVLIPTYQVRYHVLMTAIKIHLEPLGVRVTTGVPYLTPEDDEVLPVGGFFTYITFPSKLPTADVIAQRARSEHALVFAYGQLFAVEGDDTSLARSNEGFGRGARLCWAWHEEAEIEEGIARLGALLRSMFAEANNG